MGNALGGKGLPYNPEEKLQQRFTSIWDVRSGSSASDPLSKVTIFTFDKRGGAGGAAGSTPVAMAARAGDVALAQNALKRMKSLRHPYVLKLVDSAETDDSIVLVTEAAVPLSQWLAEHRPSGAASSGGGSDDDFTAACIWGLYSLLQAIAFVSGDGRLLHGNVQPDAIYVTKGGDWKLAGFELCVPAATDGSGSPDRAFTDADATGAACPELFRSPERVARDWGTLRGVGHGCLDAFSLGATIADVFCGPLRSSADLKAALAAAAAGGGGSGIPPALRPIVSRLTAPSPRARPVDFASLASSCEYFRHPLVGALLFLDNLALKEPADKQRFFKTSLPALIAKGRSAVPDSIATYRVVSGGHGHASASGGGAVVQLAGSGGGVAVIARASVCHPQAAIHPIARLPACFLLLLLQLPALMNALEFGAAGGGGTVVLAPILELGSRLPEAEYNRDIVP